MMQPNSPCPIALEHMDQYRALYDASPVHAADTGFVNLWGWAEYFGLDLVFDGTLVWVRQTKQPERQYAAPDTPLWWSAVGPWHEVDWHAPSLLDQGGVFTRVPEALALAWKEALGDRVELAEARGQWEYLYEAEALATLAGNKYHKKKNHVNSFFKNYSAVFRGVTMDCVEDVLFMQKEWCRWRECMDSPSLVAENSVIRRVLESWDVLPGLRGGTLYVDNKMVAYTIGEMLDADTMVIHFEKAKPEFRGVYQAINQKFAASQRNIKFLNREQDMDEPGLRKAKESYHPCGFVKKYEVTVRAK